MQAPPPVLFARTPARFQKNQLLNFAEKRDVEIFGARNLIVNYGEITREEVRQAAEAYQLANDRRAQDSDMLFHCLSGSLKAIIDATYTYSLSNTDMARAALSSLDKYMESRQLL